MRIFINRRSIKLWLVSFLFIFFISAPGVRAQKKVSDKHIKIAESFIASNDSIIINKNIIFIVEPFDLKLEEPSVGVQFYRDGYIYLLDTKNQNKDLEASFGILDTYFQPLENGKSTKPSYFSPDFAFPYPTESVTFTAGYKTMYFTKTAKPLNRKSPVKIFESHSVQTKKGNGWSKKFFEMPFNGKDYSCLEPCISEDGKLMIFASDMPGGFGKYDLYAIVKKEDSWGIPVNLGSKINTSENENYPYLSGNGILYFSSNGHKGYGGFDIFYSKYNGMRWSTPVNLGKGINSSGNDIAFTQSKENTENAFFSSNRNLYKNRYQVFAAKLKSGKKELTGKRLITDSNLLMLKRENTKPETKIIEKETTSEAPDNIEDRIVFRIQLMSSTTPTKQTRQLIGSRNYNIFEYYYKGSYRQTIGNYASPAEALKLAEECRKSGFKEAFVVALKGKTRILDKDVFKTKKPTIRKTDIVPEKKTNTQSQINTKQINYRIQITSSSKSLGNFIVNIEGKDYSAFEYKYKGVYRYTIGNFSQINKARVLQQKCRKTKYNQAFVVKFKGNSRL